MKKLALGKVAEESYQDFLDTLDAASKADEKLGLQALEGLKPDMEPDWKTYKLMEGMGYSYGVALTRAYTNDLSAEDLAQPEKIRALLDNLSMMYNEIDSRREMNNDTVIRMAAEELPHLIPEWMDLDQVIAHAKASYSGKGVYFNDFHWAVLQSINDIATGLDFFLLADKRPNELVFRREGTGGEYIPKALLDLSEEEEKTLLKSVVRESNKKIAEQTSYGIRQEPLPKTGDFAILYWSNGPSMWFEDQRADSAMRARDAGQKSIRLDANQVLVPYHPALVRKVVAGLDDLPLYVYSLEAKERGEYPEPTQKNVQEALRSIVKAQLPEEDHAEQALLTAEIFGLLVKARRYDPVAYHQVRMWLALLPVNVFPFARLIEQWMRF